MRTLAWIWATSCSQSSRASNTNTIKYRDRALIIKLKLHFYIVDHAARCLLFKKMPAIKYFKALVLMCEPVKSP